MRLVWRRAVPGDGGAEGRVSVLAVGVRGGQHRLSRGLRVGELT